MKRGAIPTSYGPQRAALRSIAMAAVALTWFVQQAVVNVAAGQGAQREGAPGAAAASSAPAGAVPRMADGHPDLSGVWWGGADIGAARGRGGGGRGGGRGGAQGTPPATFMSLYKPEWAAKAKTLGDKDDPTLRCIPTAFGTLNISLYDVGAVGQIISTPTMVVMLTETYHGFRLVPTDGRPHPDNLPPAYRGDSIGRWEGDTFVVDTKGLNEKFWFSNGGLPHTEQLHLIERFTRTEMNTMKYEVTIDDPGAYTRSWTAAWTLQWVPEDLPISYCQDNRP